MMSAQQPQPVRWCPSPPCQSQFVHRPPAPRFPRPATILIENFFRVCLAMQLPPSGASSNQACGWSSGLHTGKVDGRTAASKSGNITWGGLIVAAVRCHRNHAAVTEFKLVVFWGQLAWGRGRATVSGGLIT